MEQKPRRRTTRGATPADPKTFTETEVKKAVAKALADQQEAELTKATREGVAQLQTEFGAVQQGFNEVLSKVDKSNNLKQEILDIQKESVAKMGDHLADVQPIALPDWSMEEKRALRSTVVDFLSRLRTRAFLASSWKRRTAIAGSIIAALSLLLAAASSIYAALHK